MSKCTKSKSLYHTKPNNTKKMIKNDQIYVWDQIQKNPNLFCWIPKSIYSEHVDKQNIHEKNANIQDIPPPILYEGEDFENIIENVRIEKNKKLNKLLKDKIDLISADDPAKYPIVKKFIADNGLKLYGGAALNLYMPVKYRFYDRGAIPDYDMYSPTPWKHAVQLSNIMYKAGYEFTEAKGGIHSGTYKVFSNFWPVADITYMDPYTFKKMETRKKQGMNILAPNPLAMDMYKELSQPGGNISRWGKVATRLKLLNRFSNSGDLNKNQHCNFDHIFKGDDVKLPRDIRNLLKTTYTFINRKQLIHIGPIAFNSLIDAGGGNKKITIDHYEVLSDNAHDDIQDLFTLLMKKNPGISILTSHRPWRPLESIAYYIHTDNGHLICQISQLTLCIPFIKIKGKLVATVDYQKFELYNDIVFEDYTDKKTSKCKLKYLTEIQNKYYINHNITELTYSPFQRFIGKCKGPTEDIPKHVYMSRWIDRIINSKKIRKLDPSHSDLYIRGVKGKHIKIIPKPEIDNACYDLDEYDCNYPCSWDKYDGKCENITKYPYRPDDNN